MEIFQFLFAALCVILVLIAVEYQQNILCSFLNGYTNLYLRKQRATLGVCILTSRDNTQQRQAIRETWLKNMYNLQIDDKSFKAVFVVGNSCPIHPENRLDINNCDRWNMTMNVWEDVISAFQVSPNISETVTMPISRLSVKVLHSVTLRRMGIFEGVFNITEFRPVTLSLFNGFTEEEIVSVKFSKEDTGVLQEGYYYQPVQPLLLPKGFECEISMSNIETYGYHFQNTNFLMGKVMMNDGGALHLEGMNEDRTYIKKSELNHFISFSFTINDKEELQEKHQNQEKLDLIWQQKQVSIDNDLLKERNKYSDLLMVDIIDAYRNLPQKLLTCHQWIHENWDVMYIMKVDDDCFVDLDLILDKLSSIKEHKLWWGNFRSDWLVERHGKWKEKDYTASTYPKFACGSGNIVSWDIHNWLIRNLNDLFTYQGEDVSMGIWLSALGVNYYQDIEWMCNKTCNKDRVPLVVPELSTDELNTYWKNKQLCGNPCNCNGG